MRQEKKKKREPEIEGIKELEVMPEVAIEFAQQVRALQETLFTIPRKFPRHLQPIEFGQEYKKRRRDGEDAYCLVYFQMIRALRLAEEKQSQGTLIEKTLAEEAEVALWAYKDAPEDWEIFTRFWQLLLFLEKLRKDGRLEITTTEQLTELYVMLKKQLPFT